MSDRPWFPLFVDLSGTDILFIGGGRIAARRICVLEPFAEKITVVAPEADEHVRSLHEAGRICWIKRAFAPEDLDGRGLVFAATDDSELNALVASMCRDKGITVNTSSDRDLCDFYFPGIVRQGETVVGVSASGKDHFKARRIRERISEILEEEIPPEKASEAGSEGTAAEDTGR